MKIDSLEAFGDIRGRRAGNVRSVYFVRAEGICPDYGERITKLDKRLSADVSCIYRRIDTFPVIRSADDVEFYGKAADILLNGEYKNILRNKLSEEAVKNICEAVMWVHSEIKNARRDYTPTMMKNLAAYMLFVLESVTCLLESGKKSRKLVCRGDGGFKAYCFCMLCTALGIDVCMLCTDKPPSVPPPLLERSVPFTVGAFGNVILPPFEQHMQNVGKNADMPVKNISISAPRKAEVQKAPTPAVLTRTLTERRELSFEELARLAVSVVMIAVHDSKGDIASTGSGIAIGRDGYILTNCHVASGGRKFSVRLENEDKIFKTKEIIKYNPDLDMAVIRIDKQLEPLKIYSGSELVRGQRVVAIGSPLGMFNSVSDGIISGLRRVGEMDMIQFTAPISGGSSGGALLNMYGEVIGMSTAGIEGGQNLNLAVSCTQIIPFISGFIS